MNATLTILLIGILVASACSVIGCFLVLRKMALMADAISHAILPGLVAGYFLARGPNLLAGFLGAATAGLITVLCVEALQSTRKVAGESAIGIVFPAMFALGTFLVSKYFANVHLDTDAILYGNIEFSPFDLLIAGNFNFGPQSLWVMGILCVINFSFVALFYKELKVATFDPGLAATLGFSPALIHYMLMGIVSITTVGAFTAVGAVLVVALVVVPAATAYLLTDRLPAMIGLSVLIGGLAAVGGFLIANTFDASIAGSMATMCGVFFLLAQMFSPSQGLVAKILRLRRQRVQFAVETLVVHLFHHEGTPESRAESEIGHLQAGLRWAPDFAQQIVGRAGADGFIERSNGNLILTERGRGLAQTVTPKV